MKTFVLLAMILGLSAPAYGQQSSRPDTLVGRILTDSGAAIGGATVTATRAPDRSFLSVTSEADGTFKIIFAEGTGDYLVHAIAPGYLSTRQRVTKGESAVIPPITLKLHSAVQALPSVEIKEARPRPERDNGSFAPGTGEASRLMDGVYGALSPGQAGNFNAIALTMPGMVSTGSGFSVLGMPSSANGTTLNGMSFGGESAPRDVKMRTRVATASYDPSIGWFAGANTSVEIEQGNIFSFRKGHLTIDAPPLQAAPRQSLGSSSEFTSVDAGVAQDGAFDNDRFLYNLGAQGRIRQYDATPFERASDVTLNEAGIGASAASSLRSALASKGIPVDAGTSPISNQNRSLSFLGRLDHAPYNWTTFQQEKTAWSVVGFGSISTAPNSSNLPTSTAGVGESSRATSGGGQLLFSTIVKKNLLVDARSTLSLSHDTSRPLQRLPYGVIEVGSQQDGADTLFTAVSVGGAGEDGSSRRDATWETRGRFEFYAPHTTNHYIRVTTDARRDEFHWSGHSNSLGSFFYQSLEDFEASRPSEFTRTLSQPDRTGSEWNGFVSANDSWRVRPTLRVLYGARFEGNRFGERPQFNAALFDALGIRNDAVPNTLHLSPRIGFTWTVKEGQAMQQFNSFGNFYLSTGRYIRGGIGEFRDFMPATLLSGASALTGLDDGSIRIRCIGPAVPNAAWQSFTNADAIPRACADGSSGQTFSDSRRSVELFDADYTARRVWRANLAYSSGYRAIDYTVEGLFSVGRDLPEFVDHNFDAIAKFKTADGRPVFVRPSSIDARTGVTSSLDSRIANDFGAVIGNVSSATNHAQQISLILSQAHRGFRRLYLSGSYTLGSSTSIGNGFSGSSFDNPNLRERSKSSFDARHQFRLQGGAMYRSFLLTMFAGVQSGLPFTPVVASDVNGDGFANDRAFVFEPSSSGTSVATAMASLIDRSPGRIRDCLERQAGRAAARNSCRGPWSSTMNAQISTLRELPLLHRRGNIYLSLSNPLGGIDQLVHGSNHLRGWGSRAVPDATLLSVRGFDQSSSKFLYEVNPQFGKARRIDALTRSPFVATLDIQLDLGKAMPVQQMERWLTPGRRGHAGKKLTADELKRRYKRNVNDPYQPLLNESDSLLLTRKQAEAIREVQKVYLAQADSIWTPVAERLAALPDDFDAKAALKIQEDAVDRAWENARLSVRANLDKLLDPLQIAIVPGPAGFLYKADKPVHIRSYMF